MTVLAVGQREWQQPEEAPPSPVLAPAPPELAPIPRGGQGKRLDAVFWVSVLAATLLLIWSTLSTTIDRVDEGVLSMARLLPPTYWAGFALLLASTILWYFRGETKAFHFLLVALWIGYLFLGPELMEAHPRGFSSYSQAWGVAYVLEGREREFAYFPWLGFHYAFAVVGELTDIGYLAMIRVGLLVMYLTLAVGFIGFFGRVLPDKKSILLATLVGLAMFAVLGVGFTPHQMAFGLMLFGFSFLASLDASPVVNRLVLIGIFCAILITHGLTALVVVYVAAMAALVRWKPSVVGRWSPSTASLSLLFATLFVGWLLYSSDFWFATAVRAFRDTVLREPIAFTSPFNHVSPARGGGRAEVSLLTFAFLAVLLAWLVSVVARRGFWNGLRRDRLFPLLVISGMPILILGTGNFTYEGFLRVFFYAIPFLAWFLARESVARTTAAAFLVLLLGLGFVLLYAREFEELPTSQQFAGANFLVDVAEPDASVIQGDCLFLGAITNAIDAPRSLACPVPHPADPQLELAPGPGDYTFIVLSDFGERTATFAFGKPWWESLRNSVQGEGFAKFYSNGGYDVFTRQSPSR